MNQTNLCSVAELKKRIYSEEVRVLEVSWFMPAANIDVHQQFSEAHIPGALFFDIDEVCDQNSSLPHMLPSVSQFENALTDLGIQNADSVVVYDSAGLFSAARVWWMFKVFGHEQVQILDGGLPAWIAADGKVEQGSGESDSQSRQAILADKKPYKASFNETFLADRDVLIKNIESGEFLVLDARSHGRFTGEQPEPRKGLESGHMPRSQSLPFDRLIEGGRLKPKQELAKVFAEFGLTAANDDRAIVTSCGSGVTAAIITLALNEAGFGMHKLYDGAWAEWASAVDTTILRGDA